MAYNQYDEGVSKRSSAYRGQSVGGNISNGALPGNSNIAGGGDQVIATSSNIDGKSQLDTPRGVNNLPDDPKAFASLTPANGFVGQSLLGTLFAGVNLIQTSGVTTASSGLRTVSLGVTNALGITTVNWSGVTFPASGTIANASGAGYSFSGQSIVWNNGTYANYAKPIASGWVPSGLTTFSVTYTYSGATVNNNITSVLPIGRQQAVLGNVGSLGAGSSFGGSDITR